MLRRLYLLSEGERQPARMQIVIARMPFELLTDNPRVQGLFGRGGHTDIAHKKPDVRQLRRPNVRQQPHINRPKSSIETVAGVLTECLSVSQEENSGGSGKQGDDCLFNEHEQILRRLYISNSTVNMIFLLAMPPHAHP